MERILQSLNNMTSIKIACLQLSLAEEEYLEAKKNYQEKEKVED